MLKALYFPHTDVTNPLIIKNALLLWDSLETIVPRRSWVPKRVPGDKALNEGIDLVVRPRVPTIDERAIAHHALRDALKSGLVAELLTMAPPGWGMRRHFLVYPEKFLDETWALLEHDGVAQWLAEETDYSVPPVLGFLMMSLLADSCAGTQVQKVTDRVDAYSWLSAQHARALGSQRIVGLAPSQVAPAYDRLVTLTLDVLDARAIPLSKLIAFRKREHSGRGADYSAMRRRYLKLLQNHLERVGTEVRTKADLRELEHQFREDLKVDLADLKAELRLASVKALFSNGVASSIVIAAGAWTAASLAAPVAAGALATSGVIPLMNAAVKLRGERRATLQRHTSSWLYLATKGRLRLQ